MSSTLTDRSPVGIRRGNYLTILNLGWDYDKILFTLENKKQNYYVSVLIIARTRRLVSEVNTINLPGDAALSEE